MRALVALAWLAAGIAAAHAERDWPSSRFRGAPVEPPPCTCRSPAGATELGDEACLATPSGGRLARCVMVLNTTSWEFGTRRCEPDLTH